MSSRTGRNYRFAAAGIVVTAVAQGLIGSYFAKNAIFFATAALCVPALVALRFIKPDEIDYCRARNAVPGEGAKPQALKLVTLAEEVAVDKDRVAIERLIADDYHFTSPIDNSLDRETYFEVCWPNSKAMIGFDYIYQTEDRNRAFIVYEGRTDSGKAFRNCEVHTIRDGQLVASEVYFGWDLPHKVPNGEHVN